MISTNVLLSMHNNITKKQGECNMLSGVHPVFFFSFQEPIFVNFTYNFVKKYFCEKFSYFCEKVFFSFFSLGKKM